MEYNVIMNSTSNTNTSVTMDNEILDGLTSFKYLQTALSKEGTCNLKICTLITTATGKDVMARLEKKYQHQLPYQV